MVDELARRVQALAAVTQQAGGVGLAVQVEEEGAVHHRQAAVEHVKAVLQLGWRGGRREGRREQRRERGVEIWTHNAVHNSSVCRRISLIMT